MIKKLKVVEAAEKANAAALTAVSNQQSTLISKQKTQNGLRKAEEDKSKEVGDKIAEIEKDFGADDPGGIMGHTDGLHTLAKAWLDALGNATAADDAVTKQEGVLKAAQSAQSLTSGDLTKAEPAALPGLQQKAHDACGEMRKATAP